MNNIGYGWMESICYDSYLGVNTIGNTYFYIKNIRSQYVYCSSNMINICAVQGISIIGNYDRSMNWDSNSPQTNDNHSMFKADDNSVLNNKTVSKSSFTIPLLGGIQKEIRTIKYPLFDANYNIIGLLGVATDTTVNTNRNMRNESVTIRHQKTMLLLFKLFVDEGHHRLESPC